jgi:hypothetical protein
MSKTITTSKQLEAFLSKLVTKSVSYAKTELEKMHENSFSYLQEQDEPEEKDEEPEVKDEKEVSAKSKDDEYVDPDDVKDPMERQPRKEPSRPETGSEVKLHHILYDINQIRSGRSLKDPDVKGNLGDYFNKLDNAERIALSEFLEGLTDVIVKGVPADEAELPSDEVVIKEPESKKAKPDSDDNEESKSSNPESSPAEKSEKSAEDITPPIQVRR